MLRYILGRLAGLALVILIVSIITFLIMHSVPGGPFDEERQPLPPAAKANILKKYGLDKPIWEQYIRYMWNALHLDFCFNVPGTTERVIELIGRVWPVTLVLGGLTILVSYLSGLALGIIAAVRQNTWVDYLVTFTATMNITIPNFVIAVWLIFVFSISLGWFPTGGWDGPRTVIMPLIAYSLAPTALVARYTRASLLEVIRSDYVRTARSKGLPESRVITRHALKNSLIPLITVLGPEIPNLATGSIFIEATFRIPGLGKFFVTSTFKRDYPMIMAMVLLIALLWGVTYLISDVLYTVADPRIRLKEEK